ncbi:transposase [Planctomycetes bacterium TBK1r]|jgi:transposase-like protein|uniref:Transposase n=1 Tax=Stieleria magnilauensis TaxID=2527963 RepID=A0ABX5XV18_9BACT|nr:Transposase [Planctomycetes bacterium TBK1r]
MSRRKRRSFTDTQKADAVRRHLNDQIPVSQIADELDVQPTMIHNWIKTAMAQIENAFSSPRSAKAQAAKQDAQIQKLQDKLDTKNEVIAELMEENIRAKKENGEL